MTTFIPDAATAAAIETAAREKAVADFLGHIRLSLAVWQIDADVRTGCEHVVVWLRRVTDELAALGARPAPPD